MNVKIFLFVRIRILLHTVPTAMHCNLNSLFHLFASTALPKSTNSALVGLNDGFSFFCH
jgi:hypothetical protein